MELPIKQIVVGERSRREARNLDSLRHSIRERGLLHPPVVRPVGKRYELVAGYRRLEALKAEGFDRIVVTVAHNLTDELAALHAEGEENTEREPFTPSEAAAHAERIEQVIAAKAKERQRAAGGADPGSSKLDEPPSDRRTDSRLAKATGMGRSSLRKARAVVNAATDESLPEPVREVAKAAVEEMDRTGKVDGAHKKVEAAKFEHSDTGRASAALNEYVMDDADVQRALWQKNFAKARVALAQIAIYTPRSVVDNEDPAELDSLGRLVGDLVDWHRQIEALRSRPLRAISGGKP